VEKEIRVGKAKSFKIVDGDISDGYHTFDELNDVILRLKEFTARI